MTNSTNSTFVKKLDDADTFESIITDVTISSDLISKDQERYNTLYNAFKNKGIIKSSRDNIKWIASKWKTIYKYILDVYQSVTLRYYLEGLANILLAIDKDKYKEITRPMYNLGKSLQVEKDKERLEGVMTESELKNYVSYNDLVAERERLFNVWNDNLNNKEANIYHLLLAVNTYLPPLRQNWNEMTLFKDTKPPPNDDINYLWEYKKDKWAIVMNYDKIENKRRANGKDREIFKLDDDIKGITNGKRLNDIIKLSLDYFPRDYVLVSPRLNGDKPMSPRNYDNILATIFNPKKPTTNILRKSYINYWHSEKISPKNKMEIARRMRHTLNVASSFYQKINTDDKKDISLDIFELPKIKKSKPKVLKEVSKPVKVPYNPVEYSRKYREENGEELNEKRRNDYEMNKKAILRNKILRNLNNGLTSKPTQMTIDRYGLYYDDDKDKWDYEENNNEPVTRTK